MYFLICQRFIKHSCHILWGSMVWGILVWSILLYNKFCMFSTFPIPVCLHPLDHLVFPLLYGAESNWVIFASKRSKSSQPVSNPYGKSLGPFNMIHSLFASFSRSDNHRLWDVSVVVVSFILASGISSEILDSEWQKAQAFAMPTAFCLDFWPMS